MTKNTTKSPYIKYSTLLAFAIAACSQAHADTLFSDGNFSSFPTGWTTSTPTDTSITVVAEAPATGSNTNSLHFADDSTSGRATASVDIDGGITLTSAMTLEFDINMTMVMQDSTHTEYNQLFMRVYDSSGTTNSAHAATALLFSRANGAGSATSRFGFANGSGITSGYFDPESWYHLSIAFSEIGGAGTVATLTGKDGAKVYNTSNSEVASLKITQAFGGSVSDFKSLFLASATDNSYFLDANITNMATSTIPEPASATLLTSMLVGIFMIHRRAKRD
ncbi:hypothetical protein SH580_03230 [Coraliomargarita algicola]|uniref:PEP-CTERM protein-sorting domain-containing protein n=1 Tax=Coraliomargarita algicola TaxID=3092156 RepID=A0ABZ0RKI5_9BACT|nr:hypothetical protein [Coraliomargarita sp. J2-16]WPJ96716.1 hypothetical protein SH580_03230 [Coraliomargarita sp. J2-16]